VGRLNVTCFVFNRISGMTENWHSEAGVMVVAATLSRAQELINAVRRPLGDDDPIGVPDDAIAVADYEAERMLLFPDAGCC
jgi:hypothetical protein